MKKKVVIGIVGIGVIAAGWLVYIKFIRDRNKRIIREGSFEIVIDDSYKPE
jgi:hypothetical protein